LYEETVADGSGDPDLPATLQPQPNSIDMKDGIYKTAPIIGTHMSGFRRAERCFIETNVETPLGDYQIHARYHTGFRPTKNLSFGCGVRKLWPGKLRKRLWQRMKMI
jgi:hypothetical protein